jgi:hypothetical protein
MVLFQVGELLQFTNQVGNKGTILQPENHPFFLQIFPSRCEGASVSG